MSSAQAAMASPFFLDKKRGEKNQAPNLNSHKT
jgi:hypothetical protein